MIKWLLIVSFLVTGCYRAPLNKSIVMLDGPLARCTAFQVEAPSGRTYLLTAGHCFLAMNLEGSFTVRTEDGATLERKVVAVDKDADIMLLEGVPGMRGFKAALSDEAGEKVRILGHGYGLPLWEVDGFIIGDMQMLDWVETLCSVAAAPGHSGSPAIDPSGHVVGVVSTSNGVISGMTRLMDLQAFLKGY